jgi:integrase
MTWDELSDDMSVWTMPGERTKNGVTAVVPLSAPARDLIRGLLPGNSAEVKGIASGALVLPGAANTPFSGWSKAKAALDRAVAEARGAGLAPWSVHDLRRTVATDYSASGCGSK